MNKALWGWLIATGLLLARIAYLELQEGRIDVVDGAAEVMSLVLLTGGLLAGLLGITGMLGMLGWVPRPGKK
ncbi:hypothetical protein [Pseudoduganella umbonata]|uniref:Mg2+/citrate symporter n=1 Tax=Pseudoduganella umbonata TaxID=864828 RepID=A0A4P8I010_9BURK|nr:hypothetical protein [Pseudoduganella umbonata]MBB3224067.1 Mg2+/citrate symporter [Pseudoduganella umbonata]QCP14065.1 hypothetical protein FCL38_29350 [Pseudoduganella umbonata]